MNNYSHRAVVPSSNGSNVETIFDGGRSTRKATLCEMGNPVRMYGKVDGEKVMVECYQNGYRSILVYANCRKTARRLAEQISESCPR
ncbi:MAG: hypothetical protein WC533_03460 [Candidatus Pacearchaeota archaeon]